MSGYLVDLEAVKADLRLVLYIGHTYDDETGCSVCGDRSVAHYCGPQEAARDRLKELARA